MEDGKARVAAPPPSPRAFLVFLRGGGWWCERVKEKNSSDLLILQTFSDGILIRGSGQGGKLSLVRWDCRDT